MLRDLRVTSITLEEGKVLSMAPASQFFAGAGGSIRAGALVALVDLAAANVAIYEAAPDWIATFDLGMSSHIPIIKGPALIMASPLRVGEKTVIVDCEIRDGEGKTDPENPDFSSAKPAGRAIASFFKIPASATRMNKTQRPQPGERNQLFVPGDTVPETSDLETKMEIQTLDAASGILSLKKTNYMENSFGTLNGGAVAIACEMSAEKIITAKLDGKSLSATNIYMHYLAQMGNGVAVTVADATASKDSGAYCRVELREYPEISKDNIPQFSDKPESYKLLSVADIYAH